MAPIPVMTTRRRIAGGVGAGARSATWEAVRASRAIRNASQAGERSRRDAMNEYRPDHIRGGKDPDEWPVGAVPDVQHANERAAIDWFETPLHVHAGSNAADMPEPDCRGRMVHLHFREPPRRPAE